MLSEVAQCYELLEASEQGTNKFILLVSIQKHFLRKKQIHCFKLYKVFHALEWELFFYLEIIDLF